jgi:hypothetical protein
MRSADSNDFGTAGNTSLDTTGTVLDDQAVLRVVAELCSS